MFKLLQRFVAVAPIVVALAVCQETWALAGTVGTINGRVTDDTGKPIADVHVSAVAPSYSIKTPPGRMGSTTLPVCRRHIHADVR